MSKPKEISHQLQVWMEKVNITQSQLAERSGVSQPWVSRIVRGDFKRITEPVQALCKYADIDIKRRRLEDPEAVQEIWDGINEIWDGSRQSAQDIKKLLITVSRMRS